MKFFTYRIQFIFIIVLYGLVFIGLYNISLFFKKQTDVSGISAQHIKNKFTERKNYYHQFFQPHFSVITAIESNPSFKKFIHTGTNRTETEELFLALKQASSCTIKIRYFDLKGNEIIKIYGSPSHSKFSPKNLSKISPINQLQNQSDLSYFHYFKNVPKEETRSFKTTLKTDHNITVIPKEPVIHFGSPVFHGDEKKGVLIVTVCLKEFYSLFQKTTLYDIHIIDQYGRFLLTTNPEDSIIGDNFEKHTVHTKFGEDMAYEILSQDEFLSDTFYSYLLNYSLHTEQELKLILSLKFDTLTEATEDKTSLMLWMMLLTILLMLPAAIYLSRMPDNLLKKLDKQAHFDRLTDIPNQVSLFKDLTPDNNKTIITIHLDGFRQINSVYGYMLADEILKTFALKLQELSKRLNLKAYKGPSNIFILTGHFLKNNALSKELKNIHKHLENIKINLVDKHEITLDITIGSSSANSKKSATEKLIDSETALKQARETHINFVILNTEINIQNIYKENLNTLSIIKKAINQHRVECFYQPIYNNKTQCIDKYETLMRLKNDDGSISPPNVFLPIAKSTKYYHGLTLELITQSFLFFKDLSYEFSINLSAQDIQQKDFLPFLTQIISEYKIASRVVFEIVESENFESYAELNKFIIAVKKMGCKIAIDDFGAGYSSFEHLMRLSYLIDYIKIDGSLIKNITSDENSLLFVKNIKSFSDEMNIKVIAEFVSDQLIQDLINEMGIQYSQGYLFGKPDSKIISDD